VLDGVDVHVRAGEVVSIVGPNGCGKSTLLRLLGGLLRPETGEIQIDGSPVSGPSPTVGLVFQEARLLPWRTLADNISFPLDLAGITTAERDDRVRAAIELTALEGFAGAFPDELSGGMAQRAALARALVTDPAVLLLDEPFSALDALTRERLDVELLALWERTRTTIVLVTHSISEAVFLSDRVLVMSSRPGNVVADIRVEAPRPRHLGDVDSPALGASAARVREALTENTVLAA
jgi:NitT/TauT family transport system ATP-binding protein